MLWTTKQLAEATGLTPRHIARLIRNGQINGVMAARTYVISDEEAKRFIESRTSLEDNETDEPEQPAS